METALHVANIGILRKKQIMCVMLPFNK